MGGRNKVELGITRTYSSWADGTDIWQGVLALALLLWMRWDVARRMAEGRPPGRQTTED